MGGGAFGRAGSSSPHVTGLGSMKTERSRARRGRKRSRCHVPAQTLKGPAAGRAPLGARVTFAAGHCGLASGAVRLGGGGDWEAQNVSSPSGSCSAHLGRHPGQGPGGNEITFSSSLVQFQRDSADSGPRDLSESLCSARGLRKDSRNATGCPLGLRCGQMPEGARCVWGAVGEPGFQSPLGLG